MHQSNSDLPEFWELLRDLCCNEVETPLPRLQLNAFLNPHG